MDNLNLTHFRFRTDAGAADDNPSWAADEDAAFYPGAASVRLRVGVENTGADGTGAVPWQLYVDKNGGGYSQVTTSSAYARAVDAGSSADETAIFLRRLGLSIPDWWLDGSALDLDFANDNIHDAIGPPVTDFLSCSRASIGYAKNADGTLTQFGNDTLRITDLGLLVEDARTNYVLQSEVINFIDNYWVNPTTNISITTDALIAPNGMTTADKVALTANAGDAYLWAYSGISLTANTYYAFSWYLKTDGSSSPWCEVEVTDGVANAFGAWFNLSTGLAGTTKTVGDATVLSVSVDTLTDGWYRCIVVGKFTAARTIKPALRPSVSADNSTAATDTHFCYAWGAQLELGTFPSSYIPTSTTSATRAADTVALIGNLHSTIPDTTVPGSVVVDATLNAIPTAFWPIVGKNTDWGGILWAATDNDTQVASGGGLLATFGNSRTWLTGVKVGAAWPNTTSNGSIVGGGGTVASDVFGGQVITYLGRDTGVWSFGYFRRFTAWNTRLADATLQARTDPADPDIFPYADAAIDLDFADGTYYRRPQATDFLSCSRASIGYAKNADGTLTQFGNNTLRIGVGSGLLVEDARTNVVLSSGQLGYDESGFRWSCAFGGISDTANARMAPDGTTTATLLSLSTTGAQDWTSSTWSATGGVVYTSSIFIRLSAGVTNTSVALQVVDDSGTNYSISWFDLSTIATGSTSTGGDGTVISASIEAYEDNYYRIALTYSNTSSLNMKFRFFVCVPDNSAVGVAGDSAYAWGAQNEAGPFASSYIPTTTTSATRAADVVTSIGTLDSVIGNTVASCVISISPPLQLPDQLRMIGYYDGTYRQAYLQAGGFIKVAPASGGQASVSDPGTFLVTPSKTGTSWDGGGSSSVGNGGTVVSGSSQSSNSGAEIGSGYGYDGYLWGYIQRLAAWNTRLADGTLQARTDPDDPDIFPYADAAIDLDFADGTYYRRPLFTDYLSCSRVSIGYVKNADGTLTQFGNDTLRIGVGSGLLVEDARTNYCRASQTFTNFSYWTTAGETPTDNSTTAPDGTTTAAVFVEDATSNPHVQYQTVSTGGDQATFSVFMKKKERSFAMLMALGSGSADRYSIVVNLDTGAITSTHTIGTPTGVAASVESFANGWYRAIITMDTSSAISIGLSDSGIPTWDGGNNPTYQGDGASGAYFWGADVEPGRLASSYIPTNTVASARAADVVLAIGALDTIVINSAGGSVVVGIRENINNAERIVGSRSYAGSYVYDNGGYATWPVYGADAISISNQPAFSTGAKIGISWDGSGRSLVGDGGTVANSGTSGVFATGDFNLGHTENEAYKNIFGYYNRLTAWTYRIVDATLQGHTAP